MLTVYIRDLENDIILQGKDLILDVESAFIKIDFTVTADNVSLVKTIEGGQLIDRYHFTDRFGVRLYTSSLSSGCKAALIVNNSDAVVDIKECGLNARDAIISLCKSGYIVMDDPGVTIRDLSSDGKVEVSIDGNIFHSIAEVNNYLFNQRLQEMLR